MTSKPRQHIRHLVWWYPRGEYGRWWPHLGSSPVYEDPVPQDDWPYSKEWHRLTLVLPVPFSGTLVVGLWLERFGE